MKRRLFVLFALLLGATSYAQSTSPQSMIDGIYKYLNLDGQFTPVKTLDGNVMIDCGTEAYPRPYYIHVAGPKRGIYPVTMTTYFEYNETISSEIVKYNISNLQEVYPYIKCAVLDELYSFSVMSFVSNLAQLQKGVLDVMRMELDAVVGSYKNCLQPIPVQIGLDNNSVSQKSTKGKKSNIPLKTKSLEISSSISIEFVLVEADGLTPFYFAKTELSSEVWKAVMGSDPERSSQGYAEATFSQINAFIRALDDMTGYAFHLPNKDEWMAAFETVKRSRDNKVVEDMSNTQLEHCRDSVVINDNGVEVEKYYVRDGYMETLETRIAKDFSPVRFRLVISKEDFE